jgi:hypothetical protein
MAFPPASLQIPALGTDINSVSDGGRAKFGRVGALVGLIVVAAGCGESAVTVHTEAAVQQASLQAPGYCSTEFRTLATATEAFWAMNMEYPTDQGELVDAGLLREVVDDFALAIVGSNYALVGVEACVTFEPDESSFDAEPGATSEPSTCAADLHALQVAWEAYNADTGNPPDSEADLVEAGLLRHESPGFDLVGTRIIPVPGVCD